MIFLETITISYEQHGTISIITWVSLQSC